MKKTLLAASAATLSANVAMAGGIERTTQSALVLFEDGNHIEFSLGHAQPSLSGTDLASAQISNVAGSFTLPNAAVKVDASDKLSFALIFDRPYGADVEYGPGSTLLSGTKAEASTTAITALAKYKLNDNFSVFGGIRSQTAEGDIRLQGLAYSVFSTYQVNLSKSTGTGFVAGAAYEKPEIALRVAFTYNSEITHKMTATETGQDLTGVIGSDPLNQTGAIEVKTPESFNLEFQTGVAEDTLVFGSIRHVKHSQFRVDPTGLVAATRVLNPADPSPGLIGLEDTTTYRLGVARRFSDKFAGSVSVAYEAGGSDDLVSPLAPSNGYTQLAVGGSYDINDKTKFSAGISHTWLGDARPETGFPDVARASFTDNNAWGFGAKISVKF
ncbi:MAG: outer membrane protein transport protein [Pelagimonas sp.]